MTLPAGTGTAPNQLPPALFPPGQPNVSEVPIVRWIGDFRNPYKAAPMTPIAQPGEVVAVQGPALSQYYYVVWVEGFPGGDTFVHDFGPIAAGQSIVQQEITEVQVNDDSIGQWRFDVLDDFRLQLFQNAQQQRWAARNVSGAIDVFNKVQDPWLSATTLFNLSNQKNIFGAAVNRTNGALGSARVKCWGFRLRVALLTEGQDYEKGGTPDRIVAWLPANGRPST